MAKAVTVNRGDMSRVRFMYVGQVFKSYRQVAQLLEADILGGDSRELQCEYWKRYFKWEREKHRWIIVEIFDEPLEQAWDKVEVPKEFTLTGIVIDEKDKQRVIELLKKNNIEFK